MSDIANLVFIFGAKYLPLFVVIISVAWFLLQQAPKRKDIFILACVCLPAALLIFLAAGRLYYNPRPFAVGNFQPLVSHAADNGFPSHHMLLVSLPATIVFIFNRRLGLILWALAIFTGVSRVYVGLHHFVDIAASALISIVAVILAYFSVPRIFKRRISP